VYSISDRILSHCVPCCHWPRTAATVPLLLRQSVEQNPNFLFCIWILPRSRGSSGSIVSDYGLDDRAIGVRSLAGAKDFSSSLCVQTGSGAHPASCPMGTGGPFPGGKARPGRDAGHSPLSSAEVVNEQELYLLSSQAPPWRVAGLLYLFRDDLIRHHFT
jgi:hypothetical protein